MPDMLGPYPLDSIVTGDARVLSAAIPDESIDLVFTDPVYSQIDDYRWLAETAARGLKPEGNCLVWGFTSDIARNLAAMTPILNYRYLLCWRRFGSIYHGTSKMLAVGTYALWLDKNGGGLMYKTIADLTDESQARTKRDNGSHKWSKPKGILSKWIAAYTSQDGIVFDPFTGGGTVPAVCKQLGRQYLAFELEPGVAEMARTRVLNTQPPLFVLPPEQGRLWGE